MNPSRFLPAGRILKPHSFKGEFKFEIFCDSIEFLSQFSVLFFDDEGAKPATVRHIKPTAKGAIMSLDGVDNEETVCALMGKNLYFDKNEASLPAGEFFVSDLIGLPVIDAENARVYGKIKDIFNSGATDIYKISSPDGCEILFPAAREFVARISLDEGVFVLPIEGMFKN